MEQLIGIVVALVLIALGVGIGYAIRKYVARAQANSLEAKADAILTEAKNKQQELLMHAKEKAIEMLEQSKKDEATRRVELRSIQDRLERRETLFDQKLIELQEKQQRLEEKTKQLEQEHGKLDLLKAEQVKELERVAKLSREDAVQLLITRVETESQDDLAARVLKLERESNDVFEQKAKRILSDTIHRIASSHASDVTTSVVQLPNDEMKGRIIGKEGRNIKTLERITGCDLIVDDTPEVITISSFSPIRRQVARIALEKLILDGRIQPARIEAFVEDAKKELALDMKKSAEEALYELGITGLDPKLVMIVGRLKYRYSYGQNNLLHAKEVAYLSALLAEELGVDRALAKKAGFLHDIGKAIDHETEGGHPQIGYRILLKFGLPEEIAYCCIAHHEDKPQTLLGAIVKAADAISGGRPGARRDSYEEYITRLQDLENIATGFKGVEKAYAIQAGREVRVFVSPSDIDDYAAYTLAKDIARKIEQEMQYPGEIRVAVIRETRVIEYAK